MNNNRLEEKRNGGKKKELLYYIKNQAIRAIKKVLSSSVSNNAAGDPFAFISLIIVGMPVALPSVRSSSFKKSPSLRLR